MTPREESIAAVVDSLPPLTTEQIDGMARILAAITNQEAA